MPDVDTAALRSRHYCPATRIMLLTQPSASRYHTANPVGVSGNTDGRGELAVKLKTRPIRDLSIFAGTAVLPFLLFSVSPARGSVVDTRFTIVDSSPTSWVAHGLSDYTVSAETGWMFTTARNSSNGATIQAWGAPLPETDELSWYLNFAAPLGAEITPGFYPDFQRFPFQDWHWPGLEFRSTSRGNNRASGFFEVYEVTYDPAGEVLSFAADFTHYGEEDPDNWAIVEVRYNATVPDPGTATLAALGAFLTLCRRRRSA